MLKVTSLIENKSSRSDLKSEHGLSIFVVWNGKRILVDTGETDAFIHNAGVLGIDLNRLDATVISHNHYDHIGGLEPLLKLNRDTKVYIKSAARSEFYVKIGPFKKWIGQKKDLFKTYEDRIIFFEEQMTLDTGMHLLSNTIENMEFFCKDKHLKEKQGGRLIPDPFMHELFMVLEETDGLVIISSCSHNGIVNIVETVRNAYPGRRITHFIGGLHMMAHGNMNGLNCSEEYVTKVAEKLLSSGVENLHICHCTGFKALELLKKKMGDRVHYFQTGDTITI